jgi:hypothetical protein
MLVLVAVARCTRYDTRHLLVGSISTYICRPGGARLSFGRKCRDKRSRTRATSSALRHNNRGLEERKVCRCRWDRECVITANREVLPRKLSQARSRLSVGRERTTVVHDSVLLWTLLWALDSA